MAVPWRQPVLEPGSLPSRRTAAAFVHGFRIDETHMSMISSQYTYTLTVHVHLQLHSNLQVHLQLQLQLLSKLKSRVTPPLPSGMKIHKESKMPTTFLSKPKVNEIDCGRIVESCAKTMRSNVYEKPKYKFVIVTTKSETIRY